MSSLRKQFPRNGEVPHEISEKNKLLFLDLNLFFVKVFITRVLPVRRF